MNKIATIGFFDGVHKGHCYLFDHLLREAQQRHLQPLIVTFDKHPRAVLHSDYMPQLITTLPERQALLEQHTTTIVLPFADIHSLTAQQFMDYLRREYQVTTILMGYDHRFGSDRLPYWQDYQRVAQPLGINIVKQQEFIDGELHISSTEIRQALQNGNIVVANELLGYEYTLTGKVVKGKGIGHNIGFPTANIQPDDASKIIPRSGVYIVQALLPNRTWMPAMLNIGTNPTVGDNQLTIELHIPHIEQDLYGEQLTIRLIRFVREEKKFASLTDLRTQIQQDLSLITPSVGTES